MENVLLIRYGEIHLKGLNRPYFERALLQRIKQVTDSLGANVTREQGRIFVFGIDDEHLPGVLDSLTRVFGIHSISPAVAVNKDYATIADTALNLIRTRVASTGDSTFKVFAKRSDKSFHMDSMTLCRELGAYILHNYDGVSVNVKRPQIELTVEIRDFAYIYTDVIPAAGGMPTGTAGRCALLLSGGIDSPVAGYMVARRGVELSAVHFFSYPYTSVRARDKVVDLARLLARYTGEVKLHLVPFTEIQLAIYDSCPSKETTVLMRRLMMRIAERIAASDGARALVTGEAIAQVASQTLDSLCVTDDAVSMPVFRPLIGFDKDDIVRIAKRIDTFETSILPYEDCCTVFVPQHPVTHPKLDTLRKSELLLSDCMDDMIDRAIAETECICVRYED
ncbi:MAG: tRNA uracil 4-sulfurtransferase ThiI [Clostridia bacterium]|nr:tRNA uracil 4-sulfurtransferase ThiI [Clostridia bacterium]